MTQVEVIEMALEAGFKLHHNPDLYDCMVASDKAIERFAARVAAHTLSNIDPSKFISYQEAFEAGQLTERAACLANVKKVFGTFDSLPQSPEVNLVRSLTSIFFEAISEDVNARGKT
jgi:hypothetical protein